MRSKFTIKIDDEFMLMITIVYYTSKLLWDRLIPSVMSLVFIGISFMYVCKYLFTKLKKNELPLIAYSILFAIYIIINAVFKDDVAQMQRAIYEYILYALPLLGFIYVFPRIDMIRLSKKVSFWGCIIAILSWYEYLTRHYLIPIHGGAGILYGGSYAFRSAVFSRSALAHGVVLGFFSILMFYVYINEKTKINLLLTLFLFASILTTSSRGPLVATAAGLLVAYFLNLKFNEKGTIKHYLGILLLILLLLLIVFIMSSSFQTGNGTIDYFLLRVRTITDWTGDAGNVGRISRWNWSIQLFNTNKLWGIGPSKTGSWGTASIGVTESGVLRRLCELGLVGFLMHYTLVFFTIVGTLKRVKYLPSYMKNIVIVLIGILTMVLINDITVQSTEEPTVCFILWFSMAGLLTMNYLGTGYSRGYYGEEEILRH